MQLLVWVIPSSAQGSLLKVKSPHLLDQKTLFFSLSLYSHSFCLDSTPVSLHTGGPKNITIIVEDPIAGLGVSPPFCVPPRLPSAPL